MLARLFSSIVQLFLQYLQLRLQLVADLYLSHLLQCAHFCSSWPFTYFHDLSAAPGPARAPAPDLLQLPPQPLGLLPVLLQFVLQLLDQLLALVPLPLQLRHLALVRRRRARHLHCVGFA